MCGEGKMQRISPPRDGKGSNKNTYNLKHAELDSWSKTDGLDLILKLATASGNILTTTKKLHVEQK